MEEKNIIVTHERRVKELSLTVETTYSALNIAGINDIPTLTAFATSAEATSELSLLVKAKAFGKIRNAFIEEKKRVSALKKARKKGDKIPSVNLYGYETFVDYAEKELNTPKTSANKLANVATLIEDDGVHTVFAQTLFECGQPDFGFSQIVELAPLNVDDVKAKIISNQIRSSMSAREIAEYRKGRIRDLTAESEEIAAESKAAESKAAESKAAESKAAESKAAESVSVTLTVETWGEVLEALKNAGMERVAAAIAMQTRAAKG